MTSREKLFEALANAPQYMIDLAIAALADASLAPTTSLVDRATVIAAGMVTDPPVWDGSDGGKLARHAVKVARQIENAIATAPVGDAALRDRDGEQNPVRCEFVRMAQTADAISYVARFEMSGKSLIVMPRLDRERLLKILIVDALDETIKPGDL